MSSLEATAVLAPKLDMVLELATESGVHTFDLSEIPRVALGRHHSNDVQLRSRRVSSHHAEILSEVEGLFVRDMESTNGTYVNDELVRRKKLSSGDSIRIGGLTLVVRLVPRPEAAEKTSPDAERFAVGAVGRLVGFQEQPASAERRYDPADTPLPDLLAELSRRRSSALIRIREREREGQIHLSEGAIVDCTFRAARGQKALYRLLTLEGGTYEIESVPADSRPRTLHQPTDQLVVEGMQQVEALEKLRAKLPALDSGLVLNETCGIPVNALTADELEIYKQLIRCDTLGRVLDQSEATDFMVMLLVHALVQKGFFRTTNAPAVSLEQTVIKVRQPA